MTELNGTIRPFYADWEAYNTQLIEGIRGLTPEQLAIRPAPDGWPIWATVGHTAGARVYWFCTIFGEPGADTTPFSDPELGWEDDLDHPRTADELVPLPVEYSARFLETSTQPRNLPPTRNLP